MALTLNTAGRTAMAAALIAYLGANATIELWNGTKPASLGSPAGTKLATLTLGSTAGTEASGVITFGAVTQTAASHVDGTPTFVRIKLSGGTTVADIDVGAGAGTAQFTGTVVTGQNVTVTGLTWTMGNA